MTHIVIAGRGQVVYYLSRTFLGKGFRVTVVSSDREACVLLAQRLPEVLVVHGDASDRRILEEAGLSTADVLLAVTPADEDNLVICQLAHLLFRVPRILALVNDPDHEEVFRHLGIDAISTTHIVASLIQERAAVDQIMNLVPIGDGRVNITEVVLKGDSPVVGRALKDAHLPANSLVAAILRGAGVVVPRGGTEIQAGDRLVLVTLSENHSQVLKALTEGPK